VGNAAANLDVKFTATTGEKYYASYTSIDPNNSQLIEPSDATGMPAVFLGSATVTGTQDIVGMYNEFASGGKTMVGTGFPAGIASTTLYVPLVKKTYGASNASVGIMVQNVGSSSGQVYVAYKAGTTTYNSDDWGRTLDPGASWAWYLDSALPDAFVGSAVVTGTQDMVAIVNEQTATTGAANSAFASSEPTTLISVPLVKKVYGASAGSVGIQVQNTSGSSGQVYVTYKTGTTEYQSANWGATVEAGASETWYLDSALPNGFLGSATISSTADIVAITNEVSSGGDLYSTNAFNLSP
jgi:hypothetical protein